MSNINLKQAIRCMESLCGTLNDYDNECLRILLDAALASQAQQTELSSNPLQLDTDLAREYLVENILPKFSDSTFSVYVRSALAGDFAYQLAMYLQSQAQQEPAGWQRRLKFSSNGQVHQWELCKTSEATDAFERSPHHEYRQIFTMQSQAQQESNSASNAAMEYALKNHDLEFLHTWFHGNFDAIRKEWSDAPEAVFIGADPFYKPAPEGDKPCKQK